MNKSKGVAMTATIVAIVCNIFQWSGGARLGDNSELEKVAMSIRR
jgi:hypothetical protein